MTWNIPQASDKHAARDAAHGQAAGGRRGRAAVAAAAARAGVGAARRQQEGLQPLAQGRARQAGHVHAGLTLTLYIFIIVMDAKLAPFCELTKTISNNWK